MLYPSLQWFPGDVFADFDELQRQMERLFSPRGLSSIRAMQRGAFPAVNIGVTPESVQIYAFAPGIDPQSLDVSVDKGLLTIAGQRKTAARPSARTRLKSVYARERVEGEFRRVVSLPDDADPDRVSATYRNGIVQIEHPEARGFTPAPHRSQGRALTRRAPHERSNHHEHEAGDL